MRSRRWLRTPRGRRLDRLVGGLFVLGSLAAVLLGVLASQRAVLRAPEPTLMLVDRQGRFLGEVGEGADERLGFWPAEPMPDRVIAATLAIEDRRFYEHPGVDAIGIARALRQNAEAGEVVSGASTVAMQLARLQDPGPRTVPRKVVEALTALMLTHRYGRERVLGWYLRLAPYGNNVHGVAYAARRYFDKPLQDLSWAEVALLTALPQAPGTMNPYNPAGRRRAEARAARILDLVHEQGLMSDAEHAHALAQLAELDFGRRKERPSAALHPVLHLEGELPTLRPELRDDPLVATSLDLELQEHVQGVLRDAVREWEPRGAGNAAAVVVHLETGEVRASVGSTSWHDGRFAGSIDYTRTPRYPGSTLKPFVYATALDRGTITPATVLDDLGRGPDGIGNADHTFLGPLLPRHALGNSRNVPAVALTKEVGLDETYAAFRDLGLHDDELPAAHYGYGVSIGGMPTTLADLAGAYTVLADDGVLRPLVWVPRLERGGERRIVSEASAAQVADILSDPMARLPTFPRMGFSEYPFPVAVKTGTSPDYRDAWAVAFSETTLVALWVGHPDWTPMQGLSGYRAGARLAQQILLHLHGDLVGLHDGSFAPPEGADRVRLCALSGRRATRACDHTVSEWLLAEQVPQDDCAWHVDLGVDVRTGKIATAEVPGAFVERRSFVDLPPRYAAWAERERLPVVPGRSRWGLEETPSLEIVSPRDGVRLMRDPEAPAGQGTVELLVAADPSVEQVVWYVDGAPFAVVDRPFAARWPLEPGSHVFEARLPYTDVASAPVRLEAR